MTFTRKPHPKTLSARRDPTVRKSRRSKQENGFTLFELIVVLVVLVLLAAASLSAPAA